MSLNKLILEKDGLVIGNNQLAATGGGIYIDKNLAVNGSVNTANLNAFSSVLFTNNVISTGNLNLGSEVVLSGLSRALEKITVLNVGMSGNVDISALNSSIVLYDSPSSSNFTLNFIGNNNTTLASILNSNQSVTVVVAVRNGATAYYPTAHRIDGTSYPIFWQTGTVPSSGNTNSIDFYSYTIVKYTMPGPAMASSFYIFASQTKFA